MTRAVTRRFVACAAALLLACQRAAPPAGPQRIGETWIEDLRAIVEQELGPQGARVLLILVDADGREAAIVVQASGRRWDRAVFTHDENQQWFLHPASDARPPAVILDLVFGEIRVGAEPQQALTALPWRTVAQPRTRS
jgi:hypothetical protein